MTIEREELEPGLAALRGLTGREPDAAALGRILRGARAGAPKRRRKRIPLLGGLALAGAAAAAAYLSLLPAAPTPFAPRAGALAEGGRYELGPHRLEVDADGALRFQAIDSSAARLRVERGAARFQVAKLAPGDSFHVRTDQVLVEVIGTRFEVRAEGPCSGVAVEEGQVQVTGPAGVTRSLRAGESDRFCTPAGSLLPAGLPPEAMVREALVLVSRGAELERAASLLARYRVEHPGGAFEEDALFYLALVKAQLGHAPAAEQLVRSFEREFPTSARKQKLHQLLQQTIPR